MRIGREDIRHKGSRPPAGPSQLEEGNDHKLDLRNGARRGEHDQLAARDRKKQRI